MCSCMCIGSSVAAGTAATFDPDADALAASASGREQPIQLQRFVWLNQPTFYEAMRKRELDKEKARMAGTLHRWHVRVHMLACMHACILQRSARRGCASTAPA